MVLQEMLDWVLRWWGVVFLPLLGWLEKKRREYNSLVSKVDNLENRINDTNTKLDLKFEELSKTLNRESVERKSTAIKIDDLHKTLYQVKEDSAVNKARLEGKLG